MIDSADAIERHGVGKVADIQKVSSGKGSFGVDVWVDMNGNTTLYRPYVWDPDTLEEMKPGRLVNVDYRVGKSGTIYIDQIKPTSLTGKQEATMRGL